MQELQRASFHFAEWRAGKGADEFDSVRRTVGRERDLDAGSHLLERRWCRMVGRDDDGRDRLPPLFVGSADDSDLRHVWERCQCFFDRSRPDLLSSRNDQIAAPSVHDEPAVDEFPSIVRWQPSVGGAGVSSR